MRDEYGKMTPEEEQQRRIFIAEFEGIDPELETEEERVAREKAELEDRLQAFGAGVEAEAEEFERHRRPIEDRMLEDMRQYMGVVDAYDKRVVKADTTASDINVNITRKKTNAAEARLDDMLFPTDDENWSLDISPVPTLAGPPEQQETVGQSSQQPQQQNTMPSMMAALPQPQQDGQLPGQPGQQQPGLQSQMETGPKPEEALTPEQIAERDAKARLELMKKVMSDQLTECRYNHSGRRAIRYGCMLGTGVVKGPVLLGKSRRAWVPLTDENGKTVHVIKEVADETPGYEFVPTWDYFPTMSATRPEDSEVTFQRHWLTRKALIRLAKQPGFMPEQIRKVLQTSPNKTPPNYLIELREMAELSAVGDEKCYVVWERHGPVEFETLQACGAIGPDEQKDELVEYQGVVWVCQGIVIKAAINPMETNDQPFSVFNFEKDDSCIFGYGVPFLIREPQKVVRKAWRMLMDNSGLSVGGQIIINKAIIEPAPAADGTKKWDITPLKQWLLKDKNAKAQDAFHVFEFPNHQNELAAIFNMARQLADEESGIPPVAEGESSQHQTQTAHGLEMLMNSTNIVMRRAVSNWDDNMTVPNIQRLYDWNMQNNPRSDIKGDFTPKARGSSSLLQKETQARNILNLVNFLMNPNFIGWVKIEPLVRKMVSSMQHDPDEFIKTEAEFNKWAKEQQLAAQQQGQQGQQSMEMQRMKNDLAYQIHKDKLMDRAADRSFQAHIQDSKRDTEMMKLAQDERLTLAEISAELQKIQEKSRAERTLMADEFKVKLETGSGV